MSEFTAADKLKEIDREIAMRLRVYPGWIAKGKLSAEKANRQVDIMRAIAADYHTAALTAGMTGEK